MDFDHHATGPAAACGGNPEPAHAPGVPRGRAVILAGMHRSGTSLAAAVLASAGLNLGDRLLGPHRGNPVGHCEDLGFLEFHRRALRGIGDDPDGFSARAVATLPPDLVARADGLVAERSAAGRPWGWKDPRTTLFLDFWADRLPDAGFVFVFRNPADVADSLFRRGDWQFVHEPLRALSIWHAYNELIVAFAALHPARCVVVEIDDLIADAGATCGRIRERLRVPLADPEAVFRADLFGKDGNPRGSAITMTLAPDAYEVYRELRRLSETRRFRPPRRGTPTGSLAHTLLIHEWARASRAEAAAKDGRAREEEATSEVNRLHAERAAATTEVDRLRAERAAATTQLQVLHDERSAAADHTARLEAEARTAAERSRAVDLELSDTRATACRLEHEAAAASSHCQRLEAELTEARAGFQGLTHDLAAATDRGRRLEADLDAARNLGRRLEHELAANAAAGRRMEDELDAATARLQVLATEVSAMAIERSRLEAELVAARRWLPQWCLATGRWIRDRLASSRRDDLACPPSDDAAEPSRREAA
jgi:hypothetical protein